MTPSGITGNASPQLLAFMRYAEVFHSQSSSSSKLAGFHSTTSDSEADFLKAKTVVEYFVMVQSGQSIDTYEYNRNHDEALYETGLKVTEGRELVDVMEYTSALNEIRRNVHIKRQRDRKEALLKLMKKHFSNTGNANADIIDGSPVQSKPRTVSKLQPSELASIIFNFTSRLPNKDILQPLLGGLCSFLERQLREANHATWTIDTAVFEELPVDLMEKTYEFLLLFLTIRDNNRKWDLNMDSVEEGKGPHENLTSLTFMLDAGISNNAIRQILKGIQRLGKGQIKLGTVEIGSVTRENVGGEWDYDGGWCCVML